VSVSSAFILSSERHALKKDDRWILKEINENSILVKDRLVDVEIVVPKKSIIPALRRPSGLQSIDISPEIDWAIISRFSGDEPFFLKSLVEKGNSISFYVKKWRDYLESRRTNFAVSRRFNLSAQNNRAMAFYSELCFSPCKMFWAIQGLKNDDSKILALWFNSTINLSQILSKRAETEGAFMGIDLYILQEFLVLNPMTLSETQKNQLVAVFDNCEVADYFL
jgi:hypothetical protein